MKKGITSLYSAFRHHVRAKKKIVAPLQILSRLEDYLTKEFAGVIMAESGNSVLPILNSGKKSDGRRIDLALADGDFGQALDRASMKLHRPTIRGFIELKYVQNRHKYGYGDAQDEIAQVFKSLQKQLGPFVRPTYSNCPVKLRSHESCIYGVVLASYVRRKHEPDGKSEFIKRVRTAGRVAGFRHQDLPFPLLAPVYEDVKIQVLNAVYFVSLYSGLWRPKAAKKMVNNGITVKGKRALAASVQD